MRSVMSFKISSIEAVEKEERRAAGRAAAELTIIRLILVSWLRGGTINTERDGEEKMEKAQEET